MFVGVFVGLYNHDNSKMRASILTKLSLYVKVVDHLQLVKFWPSCASGKGVCGGAKIFGFALLQPARSVCVSSEHFFHFSFLELLHVSRGTFKVSIQKRIFEDRYCEVLYRPDVLPVTQRIVSKTARVI